MCALFWSCPVLCYVVLNVRCVTHSKNTCAVWSNKSMCYTCARETGEYWPCYICFVWGFRHTKYLCSTCAVWNWLPVLHLTVFCEAGEYVGYTSVWSCRRAEYLCYTCAQWSWLPVYYEAGYLCTMKLANTRGTLFCVEWQACWIPVLHMCSVSCGVGEHLCHTCVV